MKTKNKHVLLGLMFLMLLFVFSSSVYAASSYSKYKPILKNGYTTNGYRHSYRSFYLLDIDGNGTKELLANSSSSGGLILDIFTLKNKKVKYCGNISCRGSSIDFVYVKKHHALYSYGWINGIGGAWMQLHRLSGTKLKNYKYAYSGAVSRYSTKMEYKTGSSSISCKKVSKSSYNNFCKKYFGNKLRKTYKLRSNTESNRNKYLK